MVYRMNIESVARNILRNIIVIWIFSHIYWLECDDDDDDDNDDDDDGKDFCINDCVYIYSL